MKACLSRFLLVTATLFIAQTSFAEEDCRALENYRNEAKALLYRAQSSGLGGIDGHRYSTIIEAIDKPCLRRSPSKMVIRGGNREGAYYEPSQKVVYLNAEPLKKMTRKERSVLILHELLGAAGFSDRQYEMTLQILQLGEGRLGAQAPALWAQVKSRSQVAALSGGSGTSVGGGGDIFAIQLKQAMIETLKRLEASRVSKLNQIEMSEMYRLVLECPLEFASNASGVAVSMKNEWFIDGVPAGGELRGAKMTQVPLLVLYVDRSFARSQAKEALAGVLVQVAAQAAALAPAGRLCKIPFFPYVQLQSYNVKL